jgi:carbonic anhydrase
VNKERFGAKHRRKSAANDGEIEIDVLRTRRFDRRIGDRPLARRKAKASERARPGVAVGAWSRDGAPPPASGVVFAKIGSNRTIAPMRRCLSIGHEPGLAAQRLFEIGKSPSSRVCAQSIAVGERKMSKFSGYEYRTQPGFDMNAFEGANQAIPMKTLVIHCFDPRAAEIPQAVAAYFGDEVYPGENILDEKGNRVGSTRTMFVETNAGGRAAFALESIAAMDYVFSVQNVVVVHHSFCGTTTLTPELLISKFHDHHHADISTMFDHDSLAIMDFEKSIKHDIELLRSSPAVPKHIKLYGFFYEISSGKLTELERDIPLEIAA